jgi:hypothetical protein
VMMAIGKMVRTDCFDMGTAACVNEHDRRETQTTRA